MLRPRHPRGTRHALAGLSLLESLVAMLILALGVAGLAWTQARLLVDGRQANARATAILLIGDLNDRMLFNLATATRGGYRLAWGETPAAQDCSNRACSGTELAQADLNAWRTALSQALPAGNASVFRSTSDPRQIGIAVSWSIQDRSDAQANRVPFIAIAALDVDCPADQHCHVAYVQP